MISVLEQSREIRNQADDIIRDRGLDALLSDYGQVHYTGSYALDLMLKKDIDVTLINPDLSLQQFFELGFRIADLLKPHAAFHRNTRIRPVEDRPDDAYYWGFRFGEWNLDVWLVCESYHQASVEYLAAIRKELTPELRHVILKLKQEALRREIYGVCFGSKQLYPAVLSEHVRTFDELRDYLATRYGVMI